MKNSFNNDNVSIKNLETMSVLIESKCIDSMQGGNNFSFFIMSLVITFISVLIQKAEVSEITKTKGLKHSRFFFHSRQRCHVSFGR